MTSDFDASVPLGAKETAEFAFDLQVGLDGADVPEFDAGRLIGNAAILAVNLRGLGEVDYGSLRLVAAHHFGIRSDVLDGVLNALADLELVRLISSGRSIKTIIPQVPHFDDVYTQVGRYTDQRPLNELEQLTFHILNQLYASPINRDTLLNRLGVTIRHKESC